MWTVPAVVLNEGDREELERRVRAHTSSQREVRRARVVLMAADGVSNRQIAKAVGIDQIYVGVWRKRYVADGLKGLEDRPRAGRPRRFGPEERLAVAAKATQARPEVDSQWSHASLADALAEDGITISASHVGRMLASFDIKPHLVKGWLNRKDTPEFWDRAADVCGLYLNPPIGALVLSIDEKTAIAARSRKHPTQPVEPGRPERREFEYRRHGTASLLAALDVATGEVLATDIPRADSKHFIAFLEDIDAANPLELVIHLVMDNGSSHVSKATRAWLAGHPRFVVHYTPKHASWLNQVELVFSILTRKLLKRGEFSSRENLVDKIMDFIDQRNQSAKPFVWKYEAKRKTAA
jgi:transposase